jgi:fermentation-respiration switch protein FrsA (DUF1100 family)
MPQFDIIDRLIGIKSFASPTFAKVGKRLLHLADDSGQAQIWVLDLADGARRQLTFHDEPVAFFSGSPVDDAIVYGVDCGRDPRVPPSETDALVKDLRARGQPVETVIFAHDGHGYTRPDDRRAAFRAYLGFLARHL